jgi:hypothetical protein
MIRYNRLFKGILFGNQGFSFAKFKRPSQTRLNRIFFSNLRFFFRTLRQVQLGGKQNG